MGVPAMPNDMLLWRPVLSRATPSEAREEPASLVIATYIELLWAAVGGGIQSSLGAAGGTKVL